jgi:hypothetical protein
MEVAISRGQAEGGGDWHRRLEARLIRPLMRVITYARNVLGTDGARYEAVPTLVR